MEHSFNWPIKLVIIHGSAYQEILPGSEPQNSLSSLHYIDYFLSAVILRIIPFVFLCLGGFCSFGSIYSYRGGGVHNQGGQHRSGLPYRARVGPSPSYLW